MSTNAGNNKVAPAPLPNNEWMPTSNKSGKYIKVGGCDDIDFIESCACNDKFDDVRNDGNKNIYLPVLQKGKLVIYMWSVNKHTDTAEHIMDVALSDGTVTLSCYGSKLSDTGILWMCIFNTNMVIGCSMTSKTLVKEFLNIPCPNDLCLSKTDPDIMYTACGTSFKAKTNGLLHIGLRENKAGGTDGDKDVVNVASFGQICSINIKSGQVETVHSKVNALAGIECSTDHLVFTELYNFCEKEASKLTPGDKGVKATQVWHGTDVGGGKDCYLSDNITIYGEHSFLSAIYRKVDAKSGALMENRGISAAGWLMGKVATICMNLMSCTVDGGLENPEVALVFSQQDEFKDCCFLIYDEQSKEVHHFRFSPPKQDGVMFDGHVTHAHQHGDKLIFINFMSSHILVLDASIVSDAKAAAPR